MTITFTNNFHGTSVSLRTQTGRLTARQVAGARRALCGHVGCKCGGDLGQRGRQTHSVVMVADGGAVVIW